MVTTGCSDCDLTLNRGEKATEKPAILFNLNISTWLEAILLDRTDELQIMKDIW